MDKNLQFITFLPLSVILIFGSITSGISVVEVIGASGLNVYVDLQHDKTGSAELCVYSDAEDLDCKDINLSNYSSPYESGPWIFSPGSVGVGKEFTVCVT